MKANEAWRMDGAFSRNYSMFGLVSIVYFCGLFIVKFWRSGIYILFVLIVFFLMEFRLDKLIEEILEDQKLTINRLSLFVQSIFILFFSIYFGSTVFNILPESIYKPDDLSFITTYTKASIFSLILFMVFLSFKQMCISLKIVRPFALKSGVFGVCYRIIVIIRTILVTKTWMLFFSQKKEISIIHEFLYGKFSRATFYLGMKGFFMMFLIWDLDNTISEVSFFIKKMYKKGRLNYTCGLCKKKNVPLVYLSCQHCMCEQCAVNMLTSSPFCPICKAPIPVDPPFSCSYGYVSLSTIFCCF